jgi:DNA recombination protein RmuC
LDTQVPVSLLLLSLIGVATIIILIKVFTREKALQESLEAFKNLMADEIKSTRQELQQFTQLSFNSLGEMLGSSQKQATMVQDKRLAELNEQLTQRLGELTGQLGDKNDTLQKTVSEMLDRINSTMEKRLESLQKDNEKRLEEMRATVDEKLQKTLEDRIGQSFKLVSERLEQVYKGLGEMQNLASGVGDLKKVLSNVKTRGILGEIQLGAILEQILSREQYEENVAVKKGSTARVEYAIKFPGDEDGMVYLPIDAKFPGDSYAKLMDAYEEGNQEEIAAAGRQLDSAIKGFARDIRDKYIDPPHTTDFAIMFLPFEGLYAEAVRRGLIEVLQREYRVNIAGPTTMAALLNSLQMGFKTLAIQKRSGEVWKVLGAVRTEFDKFGVVLEQAQNRINQANEELDKLVGVRTRVIQRRLREVGSLSESESASILALSEEPSRVDR